MARRAPLSDRASGRSRLRLAELASEPAFDHFLDRAIAVLGGLWVAALFAAFAWAAWTGPFTIVAEAEPQLSTDTSWLPLAAEVARGNFFPNMPSLGTGTSGLSFYPYITLWIHGLFVALFGPSGAGAVGQVLWPTIAFLLMWKIYRIYLPRRWSLMLAAIGLIVFVPLPLRTFLIGLVHGEGWRSVNVPAPPDSAGFPIPSFTLATFLLCFLLSERRRRLSDRRLVFVTVLWALQTQVHLVNAAIGLIFWFSRFPQMLRRQRPELPNGQLVRIFVVQAAIALVTMLPAIIAWSSVLGSDAFLGQDREAPIGLFGRYYYFTYLILPLLFMAVLYRIIRIDRFELIARFWPVYLLMLVEFALVTVNLWFGIGVSAESIFSRLGVFFLHLFYYVPIIHFLTRANAMPPAGSYLGGTESHWLAIAVRNTVQWIVNEASKVYLPILFVVLTVYAGASILKVREFTRDTIAVETADARTAVGILTDGASSGSLLVSDIPGVNLMVPVEGRFATLWVSRFSNQIVSDETVARLALYAHLVGWTADDFEAFMAPDMPPAPAPITFTRGHVPQGVGYWLAFHRTVISGESALKGHQDRMRAAFMAVNPAQETVTRGVSRILSRSPLPAGVPAAEVRETQAGWLYILKP